MCTFTTGCREEILREEQIGERERGEIGSRDEERFCGENILRSMREMETLMESRGWSKGS